MANKKIYTFTWVKVKCEPSLRVQRSEILNLKHITLNKSRNTHNCVKWDLIEMVGRPLTKIKIVNLTKTIVLKNKWQKNIK